MIFVTSDNVLIFSIPRQFVGNLLETINQRYSEIIGDYQLKSQERVPNPWQIGIDGVQLDLVLSEDLVECSGCEAVPCLLIYLKIFGELGVESHGGHLTYMETENSLCGDRGIITIPLPVGDDGELVPTPDTVVLTRVRDTTKIERTKFTLTDLDWRDFVVARQYLTEPEREAVIKELDHRTEFLPPAVN